MVLRHATLLYTPPLVAGRLASHLTAVGRNIIQAHLKRSLCIVWWKYYFRGKYHFKHREINQTVLNPKTWTVLRQLQREQRRRKNTFKNEGALITSVNANVPQFTFEEPGQHIVFRCWIDAWIEFATGTSLSTEFDCEMYHPFIFNAFLTLKMGNRPRRVPCAPDAMCADCGSCGFWCVRPVRELRQRVHVHLPDAY